MPTLQRSPSHSQEHLPAPAAQLPLPTGPLGVVRRERSSEDRLWYNEQLSVPHEKLIDKAVYERMAFFGSLNPERIAFPAVARLAREALCSERSVRYALRRLESSGLVQCVFPGRGRSTSRYRVVGTNCRSDLQDVQVRPANGAPNVLREGLSVSTKISSFNASVKSIDPTPIQTKGMKKAVVLTNFPSQEERKKAKAPVRKEQVPKAPEPVFKNNQQVKLLFKLQRKLNYRADDAQAVVFDGLEYDDRKRILDRLIGEEQIAAANGQVEAPPKKPSAPRFNPVQTPIREDYCVGAHRWSEAASDGIKNCVACNAEQCATHRWAEPASDGISNCTLCNAERKVGAR